MRGGVLKAESWQNVEFIGPMFDLNDEATYQEEIENRIISNAFICCFGTADGANTFFTDIKEDIDRAVGCYKGSSAEVDS